MSNENAPSSAAFCCGLSKVVQNGAIYIHYLKTNAISSRKKIISSDSDNT